mmetsp:Transcript_22632/g.57600  ORF Transcript_22632/g.57600 Transcript_22632/m.57600 type:complete len:96 (-) Transcript_22632:310-597(-)
MSYAGYFKRVPLAVPQGLAVIGGLYMYINVFNGRPSLWSRQISKSEYNATPLQYLQHPDMNHVAFPKVPGQASVEDGLEALHHRAAHAKGHAHHH